MGRLSNGVRVMGSKDRSFTNLMEIQRQKSFVIPIPDFWSFEEAVTIPMPYLTVIIQSIDLIDKNCEEIDLYRSCLRYSLSLEA